jgi:hypothetical protein
MGKFVLTEEERKSIRGLYGLNEQTNSLSVSGSYTATNCDELHAFQGTGGKVIGDMNGIVAEKIKEWNSTGINVKPTNVTVSVNGMKVSWNITFVTSDINWVGFTSRGAGCNQSIDTRAGNDSINNGPKSVVDALKKQGKTVDKIEVINDYKYDGGNNSFKQVFYRYTLVDKTSGSKPTPTTTQPTTQNRESRVIEKEIKVSTTDINTLNTDFKKNVNTYIESEGNKNYNIVDYLFKVSSEDGVTINVRGDLYLDEK